MARMNSVARKDLRREDARLRDSARANRTAVQQQAVLDSRLGKSIGAKKERARLNKIIEREAPTPMVGDEK